MTRAPTTAATCMGTAFGLMAMTTSTAAMVTDAMVALVLLNSFFSAFANSGTYPVSGIRREPMKVKYRVPRMLTPRP